MAPAVQDTGNCFLVMNANPKEKLHELLKNFTSAMLVTRSGEEFHARPMDVAFVDDECDVWFFTDCTSPKVMELEQDERVLLTFQKDHKEYVTLNGVADIITDRATLKQHWKESFRHWFPGGEDDPRLALLHVRGREAEYWDASGAQGLRYLYEAVKARLTGTRPQVEGEDMHARVELQNA